MQVAHADGARYMEPLTKPHRRKCYCGCNGPATHRGVVNGIGLAVGCELHIRRWVKNWHNANRAMTR